MAAELACLTTDFRENNTVFFTLPAQAEKRIPVIPANPAFQDVLRKGSPETMRRYIADNLEEIKAVIRERLQAQPVPENIMRPEGRVYDESVSGGNVMEDFFVQGRISLRAGNFSLAAKCFEISAGKSKGRNRETAENHHAYALLLQGETLRARMILSSLCDGKCPFSSAYWNLACSMSEEQQRERLDILAEGICKAPHLQLLRGAVFIGVSSSHQLLTQWLLCLPMIEAQLLAFYLGYERMNSSEREKALFRIGAYVYKGEPSIPDPLEHLISPETAKEFFQAMFDRQRHAEVVEFWLHCRKRIAFLRYDFWKIRTDYLEMFGQRDMAIRAFKSELHCRLNSIADRTQFRTNKRFLEATRMRAAIFLCRCMSPELRIHGRTIFGMLSRFMDDYGISLIPENLDIKKLLAESPEEPPETWNRPAGERKMKKTVKQNVRYVRNENGYRHNARFAHA